MWTAPAAAYTDPEAVYRHQVRVVSGCRDKTKIDCLKTVHNHMHTAYCFQLVDNNPSS